MENFLAGGCACGGCMWLCWWRHFLPRHVSAAPILSRFDNHERETRCEGGERNRGYEEYKRVEIGRERRSCCGQASRRREASRGNVASGVGRRKTAFTAGAHDLVCRRCRVVNEWVKIDTYMTALEGQVLGLWLFFLLVQLMGFIPPSDYPLSYLLSIEEDDEPMWRPPIQRRVRPNAGECSIKTCPSTEI